VARLLPGGDGGRRGQRGCGLDRRRRGRHSHEDGSALFFLTGGEDKARRRLEDRVWGCGWTVRLGLLCILGRKVMRGLFFPVARIPNESVGRWRQMILFHKKQEFVPA